MFRRPRALQSFPTRRSSDLDSGGMHGEGADVDPTATHEVARDVVDDLVRVDVRVVVRRRDGERVIVELAWHEAADHEVARSEEHTSELQSPDHLVCRRLLEK